MRHFVEGRVLQSLSQVTEPSPPHVIGDIETQWVGQWLKGVVCSVWRLPAGEGRCDGVMVWWCDGVMVWRCAVHVCQCWPCLDLVTISPPLTATHGEGKEWRQWPDWWSSRSVIPCRRLDGDLISNCTTAYCWCDGEGGRGGGLWCSGRLYCSAEWQKAESEVWGGARELSWCSAAGQTQPDTDWLPCGAEHLYKLSSVTEKSQTDVIVTDCDIVTHVRTWQVTCGECHVSALGPSGKLISPSQPPSHHPLDANKVK